MQKILYLVICLLLSGSTSGVVFADNLPAVRLLLSNPAPYVGEEIVVTLEVRTHPRPQSAIIPIWPNLDSSASADLPTPPPRLEEGQAVLVQIMQRAIRPLRSGSLPLISAGVSIAGKTYHAQPVELRVQTLPERGRPDDYAGAIGQVIMQLESEGRGSREILLKLSGNASLESFPTPRAELGNGERLILLDDTTVSTSVAQERMRTLRYLYLPGGNDRGQLTFRLPVFDPYRHQYVVHKTGVRQLPLWLVRTAYLAAAILLLAFLIRNYRKSRTPRTVDEALERIVGRPPQQLCRDEIVQILQQRGADLHLLADLSAHWQALDRQNFAPVTLRIAESPTEGEKRDGRLLLQLIRMKSFWRWLLTAVEKTVTDQLRARMAKLSM